MESSPCIRQLRRLGGSDLQEVQNDVVDRSGHGYLVADTYRCNDVWAKPVYETIAVAELGSDRMVNDRKSLLSLTVVDSAKGANGWIHGFVDAHYEKSRYLGEAERTSARMVYKSVCLKQHPHVKWAAEFYPRDPT